MNPCNPQLATLMITLKTYHFMVKILKDRHLFKNLTTTLRCSLRLSNINKYELTTHISNSVDPLQESSSFGIDIYTESLQIVVQKLGQYNL